VLESEEEEEEESAGEAMAADEEDANGLTKVDRSVTDTMKE
jgi:hypothetical protein